MNQNELRPAYNAFLKSPAGQNFLKQAELLEKAIVLQGISGKTVDEKAIAMAKLEGLIELRDYMVRMSQPVKK